MSGHLGDVMKESAQAALSYVRRRAKQLGLARDFYQKVDLHVHVPEGGVPKDGPSAGITMATALVSALTGIPVRANIAMTGEITLRGRVLPIGGLKEKLIAAVRGGIETVLIPKENERDLKEIPAKVKRRLRFHYVENMDEVLRHALKLPNQQAGFSDAHARVRAAGDLRSRRRRSPRERQLGGAGAESLAQRAAGERRRWRGYAAPGPVGVPPRTSRSGPCRSTRTRARSCRRACSR